MTFSQQTHNPPNRKRKGHYYGNLKTAKIAIFQAAGCRQISEFSAYVLFNRQHLLQVFYAGHQHGNSGAVIETLITVKRITKTTIENV